MKRELQLGSADAAIDLSFWHRSFLTTIMVDHYPLFEFACSILITEYFAGEKPLRMSRKFDLVLRIFLFRIDQPSQNSQMFDARKTL